MRLAAPILWILLLCSQAVAQLESNRQPGTLGEITQLRPTYEIPEGFGVVSQRWIPVQTRGKCHGVAFDGGQVFAVTSATPGSSMRVMWDLVLVNWEKKEFKQVSREYIVDFEGKPEDPDDPKPDDPDPNRKVVRVTYVFERRDQIVPRPIQSALQKLNKQGVTAVAIDKDVKDGEGQIPDQYKVAIEAANKSGVPILVVEHTDGSSFVRRPQTEEDVLNVIRTGFESESVDDILDRLSERSK